MCFQLLQSPGHSHTTSDTKIIRGITVDLGQCSMGLGVSTNPVPVRRKGICFLSPLKPSKSPCDCKFCAFFFRYSFWYMFNEAFLRRKKLQKQMVHRYINIWKLMRPYFPLNPDWLIGILNDWFPIHNPLITGQYNQSPNIRKTTTRDTIFRTLN